MNPITPAAPEERVSTDDVRAAAEAALMLSKAYRNILMYPVEHAICRRFLETVIDHLNRIIPEHRPLRFDVEKQHLEFHRMKVLEDPTPESLPALLYRDGILWFEFHQGIDLAEMQTFLEIVRAYRHQEDEMEGDIVTALWSADFKCLRYDASDVSWDDEPDLDFPLKPEPVSNARAGAPAFSDDAPVPPEKAFSLVGRDSALWTLTAEERDNLEKMVKEEEHWDKSYALADVLLLILTQQERSDYFEAILNFITEEFQLALEEGNLRLAAQMIRKVGEIRGRYEKQEGWETPSIDMFFKIISGKEILAPLHEKRHFLETLSADDGRILRDLLSLLNPRAIAFLAPLLMEIVNPAVRKVVMEAIGILAQRNMEPLENQLASPDDEQVRQMVFILGHLQHERVVPLLYRVLSHPAETVRMEAFNAILKRNADDPERLFRLVQDPSPAIRHCLLAHFAKKRSRRVETLLLEYLETRSYNKDDATHVLDCYRALGRCGSAASLPFLRRIFLGKAWRHLLNLDAEAERQGAAMALRLLALPEAETVLEQGRRHMFSSVRKAYENARKNWR